MPKKLLISVVAILILLGGAIFTWQKQSAQQSAQENKEEKVASSDQVQNKTLDDLLVRAEEIQLPIVDTTGWRTYRDEKLGVEFMYPTGWLVEEFFSGNGTNQVICVNTSDGRYAGPESGGECSVRIELFADDTSVIGNIPDQWLQTEFLINLSKIRNTLFGDFIIVNTKGDIIASVETKEGVILINISWMREKEDVQNVFYGILQTITPIQK